MRRGTRGAIIIAAVLAVTSTRASTRLPPITTPSQQFGAAIGDDYFLASYTQLETYWKRLDQESNRLALVDIGRTEEGRTQWMAVITAPENFSRLERYKAIARRLARAEGVSDAEARALAADGKAIVLIAGGLHATEVLGAQQLIETVYQLVSGADPETVRILRDVVVLAVDANPDGHELVANWYMRHRRPADRTLAGVPRLSQKYAGHDNNRDFYIATQAETINLSRVMYDEWLPQIVYDHHQAPIDDAVMYAPPFSGPSNYLLDPLVAEGVGRFGEAIRARFKAEGKEGVASSNAPYSMWWNGGLRTTAYFHNQIGLLTETAGNPTPLRGTAARNSSFRQAVDYSVTANRAVLDLASRRREEWLLGIYGMGKGSIDRGSRDIWTATPHRPRGGSPDPRLRDARAYVIPSDQPDFPTAIRFVNALLRAGISVDRATSDFGAGGHTFPSGSFVVKAAQAFRPHVLDMFEPQDHPDDLLATGGPRAPYDVAGWTLAFQMGVRFHRVLDSFDVPVESVSGVVRPPHGALAATRDASGYVFSHRQNDAAVVLNRLLKADQAVSWSRDGMYVPATGAAEQILRRAAAELGLTFSGISQPPEGARRLRSARIALLDRYGGWSTSGWIRWILERHEFPFEVVYPPTLDDGGLSARFDVLIIPDEGTPNHGGTWKEMDAREASGSEYQSRIGEITRRNTAPALARFVRDGGTLLAIGGATWVAREFDLPISEPLAQAPRDQYFVPTSVLRVAVDNTTPLGYGFDDEVDVVFDNSPVFRVSHDVREASVRPVATFESARPLRSGWAVGQGRLHGTAAIVDARVGAGRLVLFGPEIVFRGQAHGTFRFLFNAIYSGSVERSLPAPLHRPFS